MTSLIATPVKQVIDGGAPVNPDDEMGEGNFWNQAPLN